MRVVRRQFSTAIFLLLLPLLPILAKGAVDFWAGGLRPALAPVAPDKTAALRQELVLGLDLFVRAERALRAEGGSYTRAVGRVPDVLGWLTHYYRIEVVRASRNELLVVAVGEGRRAGNDGGSPVIGDRVAIDDAFRVNANFPLPPPPRDYLLAVARMVLGSIARNGDLRLPEQSEQDLLEGVYHGYFRYESRPVSAGGRTFVAVGLQDPVRGDLVESAPAARDDYYKDASPFAWVYEHRRARWADEELHGTLEKIYLAEKIYAEHVGTYADQLEKLLPMWNGLTSLKPEASVLELQDFRLDPTLGFEAELSRRDDSERAQGRSWVVNGYGQISEVDTVDHIIDQFDQAQRSVAAFQAGGAGQAEAEEELKKMQDWQAGQFVPPEEPSPLDRATEEARKPLLIDAVQ